MAKNQSFSWKSLRYLRYFTAASVDISRFRRSSRTASLFNRYRRPVDGMNCQGPDAFAFEYAAEIHLLSTSNIYLRSSGKPVSANCLSAGGKQRPVRLA